METKIKSIIRELELSKVLDHSLDGDSLIVQTFFDDLFNGLEIDTLDEYPNSIFFVKNGHEVYMEQDYKNERLYCSYSKIWLFFESKINLNYQEIRDLIKYMVEKQLKNKVFTPWQLYRCNLYAVEQQLKNKVFTPNIGDLSKPSLVEQQLKNKVFTPLFLERKDALLLEQQLKNKVFTPKFDRYSDFNEVEQQFKNKVFKP